jgi:hypothetical protein
VDRAVTEASGSARFWGPISGMVAQRQKPSRTFRQLLQTTIAVRRTLKLVAAQMRCRFDALLAQGELVARTVRQPFGKLSTRRTTVIFAAAGLIGLALILLLLEISLRMELAEEARDAAIHVIALPSAGPQGLGVGDALPIEPTRPFSLQSVNQLGAEELSSDYAQTFGQVSREPIPLPRPRKSR